ncbi:hypothetical protein AJ79_02984 [Helicocarpus griseus UAMH5409]|uniref:Uncharacterized protein n=1 Tax=Helicocarpus griseus UAMH5409 TaxID=1447875 RepID=A0A2B7Y0D9_9EURO|nr:hypothetical protein AJ79_02984 [Helicocarpus griseus UAMH5409]
MRLQTLALALCLFESSAHPTPEEIPDFVRGNIPPAVSPSIEPWHGKLPDLNWSRSHENGISNSTSTQPNSGATLTFFTSGARILGIAVSDKVAQRTYMGIRAFFVANGAIMFWNIVEDCAEWREGADGDVKARTKLNCIWASIATLFGFIVTVDSGIHMHARLSDYFERNAVEVPGFFVHNKRDLPVIEDHLSSLLSAEVQHVGIWDDHDNDTGFLSKRKVPRDIFSTNIQGRYLHFTYMGRASNASHFRFGYGPGPETENNRRRLRNRDSKSRFNKQFFDMGGLDLVGQTDPLNDADERIYFDARDPDQYNMIVEQVACYMTPEMMNASGINFQLYNSVHKRTVAAGAIAPFTANKRSMIDKMGPKGGIETDEKCTANSRLDVPSDEL